MTLGSAMCCRSHLIAIVLGRGAWGNGAPIRDYVNSDEVASANILMPEDLPSPASFSLNGSGETQSSRWGYRIEEVSNKESHIGKRSSSPRLGPRPEDAWQLATTEVRAGYHDLQLLRSVCAHLRMSDSCVLLAST